MAYKSIVLLVIALLTSSFSNAGEANLSWTPPTQNEDGTPITDLASYEIWHGCNQSGVYDTVEVVLAPASTHIAAGLPDTGTCYFAAKATNSAGVSSVFSNEVAKLMGALEVPGVVTDTIITWQEADSGTPTVTLTQVDNGNSAPSSTSDTVVCGTGTDRMHIAIVFYEDTSGADRVSGVTLDSTPMTSLLDEVGTDGSFVPGFRIFYLAAGLGMREGNRTLSVSFDGAGKDYAIVFVLATSVTDIAGSASFANTTKRTSRYSTDAPAPGAYTMVDPTNRIIAFHASDQYDSQITETMPSIDLQNDTDTSNGFEWAVSEDAAAASTVDYGVTSTNSTMKAIGMLELAGI